MCGRYTISVEEEALLARFKVWENLGQHSPRYNVAPTQRNPVVLVNKENKRIMTPMRWGLIPSWAKEEAIGNKMINARKETIAQKPSFKTAFMKRRCLVPADGYYEWKKPTTPRRRTPFRIVLKSGEVFAFAGLWDVWKNEEGEVIPSYTLITTEADDVVRKIHPRMPVILKPDNEDEWIDPTPKDPRTLNELLEPYPSDLTEMYEVSPLVGKASIDVESLIKPVRQML
jgi:putative SOS response-associated peptidase YedK